MNISDINKTISSLLKKSKTNRILELGNTKIFTEPVTGIASSDDPLFSKFKDSYIIGKFHKTPGEWFPEGVSVISYFLPFSEKIRISNRENKMNPSTGWLYGRIEGEIVNNEVRKTIAMFISESGGKAFIPPFDSHFKIIEKKSNWSERHIAFVAGLGTFSLSKSLITEKGCAGRIGSIITDIKLQPTERKYTDINEYCSMCGACIKRCPANAIDIEGKKHQPCSDFLDETMKVFSPRYGCGKCQTKVPCENRIPKGNDK
jgi:epoxyqueuosine reductase